MGDTEGASARSQHIARCENPRCGERIDLDESLLSPDADTPPDHIHTRYDPNVSPFSRSADIATISQ